MDPKQFRNPPKQYRPSPFWSWNDDLKEEELRRQVRDLQAKGYGGYFMHARAGLMTEYLSPAWMRCVAACLDEGKKVDMESWLYDEDRWPSGFAGGLVPAENEEFRARALQCHVVEGDCLPADVKPVAFFSCSFATDGKLETIDRVFGTPQKRRPDDRLLLFGVWVQPKSGRYNLETYVDLLNPDVTEAFLRCTHDAYYRRFGREYGEFMPGIFTDEPNYNIASSRAIPWTSRLPAVFRAWNGYDLIERLPLLFFDGDNAARVRYDFWRTVTRLFVESFTRRVYARCEKQRLAFTGHYLAEDNLQGQTDVIGAAMPHYEYMHVPGIDHLRRDIRDPLTLKQVSSAAEQFGRRRILCEIFGTSGHSMTFEDQKWIADWHFALGVTFMNPHLTLYSFIGRNKRDYPPTFSYHQPYWPYMRHINDYLARCSLAVSQGKSAAELLVLHPIASFWTAYRAPLASGRQENETARRYDAGLAALVDNLLSIQRDFHLGDEMIMANHARVEGTAFCVGQCRYQAVIMPPSLNWSSATVMLLKRFVESGGRLLVVGEKPTLVDGTESADLSALLAHKAVVTCENSAESLCAVLADLVPPDVCVTDAKGAPLPAIRYQHRREGRTHIFFFCNVSRTETLAATVELAVCGKVSEWCAGDGSVVELPAEVKSGKLVLCTTFAPVGAHIFVVEEGSRPRRARATRPRKQEIIVLTGPWTFRRLHLNSLPLDYATYAVGDDSPSPRLPIFKVRRALAERFGLAPYSSCQPWVLRKLKIQPTDPAQVWLEYDFHVRELPASCYLVLEQAERATIKVNGRRIPSETKDWHWDLQFARLDIAAHLQTGRNTIEVITDYQTDTDIEDAYLVGDFGVRRSEDGHYEITAEPTALADGDWTSQGYPFYAGNMLYEKSVQLKVRKGRRVLLRLVDPKGTLFRVLVNGKDAGEVAWQPWECDVTAQVRSGINRIAIEVVSSLRNIMGPLHHVDGERLTWTGPAQFEDEAKWTDDYVLAPYGLLRGAEVVIS